MITMGMSDGPTDQPTDMMSATEAFKTDDVKAGLGPQSGSTVTSETPTQVIEMPKVSAEFETPNHLDCDSIFAYNPDSIEMSQSMGHNLGQNLGQNTDALRKPVTYVTQSKFFTPLFNAAIFDGPIRIYFAQHQESQAMKLYFSIQSRYADLRKQARDMFRERGSNIFVMLYPDVQTFEKSFAVDFDDSRFDPIAIGNGSGAEARKPAVQLDEASLQMIASDRMGSDFILGIRGPIEDKTFERLCQKMETIIRLD